MKHDLKLLGQGLLIGAPPLAILVVLFDIEPHQWSAIVAVVVCGLIGCIPMIRDEIAQARQREREGLR